MFAAVLEHATGPYPGAGYRLQQHLGVSCQSLPGDVSAPSAETTGLTACGPASVVRRNHRQFLAERNRTWSGHHASRNNRDQGRRWIHPQHTNSKRNEVSVIPSQILYLTIMQRDRFMPPTTPVPGYPKMAIVFARLFVDGEDRGVHPFLVCTSDEHGMCEGVKSVRLPPRSGGSPLDFAVTFFHRVKLPSTAFLGHGLEAPKDPHALLSKYIWRIPIGSMTLPLTAVPSAKMGATIGIDYSFRRHVQGKGPEKVPIISFRTQQLPVLYTIAIAYVLEAWAPRALEQFMSQELLPETRAGVCVVFKATMCRLLTHHFHMLGERLGAQGIFGYNLLSQMEVIITVPCWRVIDH